MSILDKLRVVALGHVNDLLDKTIDLNSPSALRQYVRDLEDALAHLKDEQAQQIGATRGLQRQIDTLTTKISTDVDTIRKLMARTDNADAQTLARQKADITVKDKANLVDLQTQLTSQKQTEEAVTKAVTQLQAKHDDMLHKVDQLTRLDQDTKAKNAAAKAITGAVSTLGNSVSVDSVEARMRAQADTAGAKFDQALGNLGDPVNNAEHNLAVDDFMASLKS